MAKKPGQTREYQFLKVYWQGNDEALDDAIEYYGGRGWELVSEGDQAQNKSDENHVVFKKLDCKAKVKKPQDSKVTITGNASPAKKRVKAHGQKANDADDWWF